MKALLFLTLLIANVSVFSCDDIQADGLVKDRAMMMAKRYSAKKIGIGVSMLWDNTRITNISIFDGDAGNGERVDRIGAIYIDMDTCVVKAKLIGMFETLDVN
ncbi:MAG: hypothetical protein KBD76_04015 [Bacteriovorax sp.]|nr:hypothetical protein [Bacteriovorax sp.]